MKIYHENPPGNHDVPMRQNVCNWTFSSKGTSLCPTWMVLWDVPYKGHTASWQPSRSCWSSPWGCFRWPLAPWGPKSAPLLITDIFCDSGFWTLPKMNPHLISHEITSGCNMSFLFWFDGVHFVTQCYGCSWFAFAMVGCWDKSFQLRRLDQGCLHLVGSWYTLTKR